MARNPTSQHLDPAGRDEIAPTDGEVEANDTDALALAGRIRDERERMNLSQAQVADALGIARAAVSAIETGRRRVSSIELKRLGELFGASVDRLLGDEPNEDPTTTALFRTAKELTESDRAQVLRFAEFLRGAGPAPEVGFEPDDADDL